MHICIHTNLPPVYICIYIYIYTYIHIYHPYMYTYMFSPSICMYKYIFACIYTHFAPVYVFILFIYTNLEPTHEQQCAETSTKYTIYSILLYIVYY